MRPIETKFSAILAAYVCLKAFFDPRNLWQINDKFGGKSWQISKLQNLLFSHAWSLTFNIKINGCGPCRVSFYRRNSAAALVAAAAAAVVAEALAAAVQAAASLAAAASLVAALK